MSNRSMGPRRLFALLAGLSLVSPATWAVFDSATKPASTNLTVVRAVPEGADIPAPTRQIVVTFDRVVVPFGDMSVDGDKSPVTIEPAARCHWHWLDSRSLACELDENDALLPANEYRFTVRKGLRAEDGNELSKPFRFTFSTQRPAVTGYSFTTWRSPGTPVIRVVFNQPVSKDSVEATLKFGLAPLEASPDIYARDVFYLLPMPGEGTSMVFPNGTGAPLSDDRPTTVPATDGTRIEAHLLLPTPGLQVARDPRIPKELEALPMQLSPVLGLTAVEWYVDGQMVSRTSVPKFSWPLERGSHEVYSRVWTSATGDSLTTSPVRFYVH